MIQEIENTNLIDIYSFIESLKLNDNINIIECGGHMGTDTVKILEMLPKCNLYCIEANKQLYDKYLLPLKNKYNNLHVMNIGLSDTNEEKTFYIDTDKRGDAGASSFLATNPLSGLRHLANIEKPITIKCIKLDDFINNNNINILDFLWLDVEIFLLSEAFKISLQTSNNCMTFLSKFDKSFSLISSISSIFIFFF